MEGKDNKGKPPGLCHKIFRFLVKNLAFYTPRKVTIGRNPSEGSKPSIREEHAAKIVAGRGAKPPSGHSFDEEGEVPLVPPIITVPVEYPEVPLVPPIITIPVEYPESLGEKESDDRFKDRELEQKKKKKVLLDHPPSLQEQQEGEVTGVRPAKPVGRLVSNIDSKVDAFIREKKRKQAFDTS